VLGLLLADAVAAEGLHHEVDVLVPMPLHVGRLVERGYDQVREIARFVAAPLALPLEPRALERIRATAPQVGLEREARRRNVQGAFAAHARVVAGRRVALLDDVVTTGSTVAAAAEALREAGAVHVQVWCVARALA
jgi:ComF family protein